MRKKISIPWNILFCSIGESIFSRIEKTGFTNVSDVISLFSRYIVWIWFQWKNFNFFYRRHRIKKRHKIDVHIYIHVWYIFLVYNPDWYQIHLVLLIGSYGCAYYRKTHSTRNISIFNIAKVIANKCIHFRKGEHKLVHLMIASRESKNNKFP